MNEGEEHQLQMERGLGAQKQAAFEAHVEPFLIAKRKDLFDVFCQVSAQNVSELQVIRMQMTALDSIEADFRHYIDTGKMAQITLNEHEGK